MDRKLLKYFFDCGDDGIIEYAMHRARLNRLEKDVLTHLMDECRTQEETAEIMLLSTRRVQELWYSAADKLLNIAWVRAFALELKR